MCGYLINSACDAHAVSTNVPRIYKNADTQPDSTGLCNKSSTAAIQLSTERDSPSSIRSGKFGGKESLKCMPCHNAEIAGTTSGTLRSTIGTISQSLWRETQATTPHRTLINSDAHAPGLGAKNSLWRDFAFCESTLEYGSLPRVRITVSAIFYAHSSSERRLRYLMPLRRSPVPPVTFKRSSSFPVFRCVVFSFEQTVVC